MLAREFKSVVGGGISDSSTAAEPKTSLRNVVKAQLILPLYVFPSIWDSSMIIFTQNPNPQCSDLTTFASQIGCNARNLSVFVHFEGRRRKRYSGFKKILLATLFRFLISSAQRSSATSWRNIWSVCSVFLFLFLFFNLYLLFLFSPDALLTVAFASPLTKCR